MNIRELPEGAVVRSVDEYTLKQTGEIDLIAPERLYVRMVDSEYAHVRGIDVGIMCYAKREPPNLAIRSNRYWVYPDSLKTNRRSLVVGLLERAYCADWRQSTFTSKVQAIVSVVYWCDSNGRSSFSDSVEESISAYQEYSDYLHRAVLSRRMTRLAASVKQKAFLFAIELCFGADAVVAARRSIARIKPERKHTRAPEERDVKLYVDTLLSIVRSLPRQLMSGDPFPFRLDMPGYTTYYFHSKGKNIRTPYFTPICNVYNFEEGRLATYEEYRANGGSPEDTSAYRSNALSNLRDAAKTLAACNADLTCEPRIRAAAFVLNAYASLFLLLTGANPSQFVLLQHSEALELAEGSAKKELTSVKFRARGKIVRYPVGGKQGLRLLREYLAFRSWLLGGKQFEYLFFGLSKTGITPSRLGNSFQSTFFLSRLRGKYLPKDSVNITPTAGRKYKSVVLHELKNKPEVVAGVLGHSVGVNVQRYSHGSKSVQASEFTLHWEAVRAAASRVKTMDSPAIAHDTSIVSGHCENSGKPVEISPDVPIKPNCKTQHGCLYCEHYSCHADEEDVQKLLSMLYVMKAVREQSRDPDHADNLLRDLCIRVDFILEAVEKTSIEAAEMVAKMRKEVNEYGRLTPFWEERMERYEAMGVVL